MAAATIMAGISLSLSPFPTFLSNSCHPGLPGLGWQQDHGCFAVPSRLLSLAMLSLPVPQRDIPDLVAQYIKLGKKKEEKGMFKVCFSGILCVGSLGIFQKAFKTAVKRREMRI